MQMKYAETLIHAIRESGIPVWVHDLKATVEWAGNMSRAFPGLDHVSEIAQCAAWWLENPTKVKRRRACVGTIRNWFKSAWQSKRRREGMGSQSEARSRADEFWRLAQDQAGKPGRG